jgi:membrane-bound ClpP family serine protease
MDVVYAISLLIVAFFLLLLEVFLPSFGALTLMAIAAFVASLFFAFEVGEVFGWSLVGVAAVGVPTLLTIAFRVFPNTALGKHMILFRKKRESPTEPRQRLSGLLGREGVTLSTLRPSGIARLDGRRLDVVTRGEMIDPDTPVRVVEVLGNRIVVRAIRSDRPAVNEGEIS